MNAVLTQTLASPLSSLSSDVLERITWYMFGNGFLHLILTGDALLRAKLARIRSITVSWDRSAFCIWSKCIPFIDSFSNLRELAIITSFNHQATLEHLDLATLPSTLESLDLRYSCVIVSLSKLFGSPQATNKNFRVIFPSLRSLFVEDRAQKPATLILNLGALPPMLQHLQIHGFNVALQCSNGVFELPQELRTLSIILDAQSSSDWRLCSHPPSSQMTYLTIESLANVILDIASVGRTLKNLSTNCALSYNGRLLFNSEWEVPIRSLLPQLESLKLDRSLTLDEFETLPLSLTSLDAPLKWKKGVSRASILKVLNEQYHSKKGDDRPFAPCLLRHFPALAELNCHSNLVSPLFPRLEELKMSPKGNLSDCPPNLRTLSGVDYAPSVDHLPRHLSALSCASLSLPYQGSSNSAFQPSNIPRLSYLKLTLPLTLELVSLLPTSLESLTVFVDNSNTLEALKRRADEEFSLPRLSSLSISGLSSDISSVEEASQYPLIISKRLIPSSITELTLQQSYRFPSPGSPDCLNSHPNLLELTSSTPHIITDLLANLPPSLLRLSINLSGPINLNNPEEFEAIRHWPPKLKSLKVYPLEEDSPTFIPIRNRESLTPHMRQSLAAGRKDRFGLPTSWPASTWSNAKISVVCEDFILGCLPRSLSELSLNPLAEGDIYHLRYRDTWLRYILDLRFVDFTAAVQKTIIYRLPLMGLFFRDSFGKFSPDVICDPVFGRLHITAPPSISSWTAPNDLRRHVFVPLLAPDRMMLNSSLPDQPLYTHRMVFQACNIFAWLILDWLFPLTIKEHPIAYGLKWINYIGASISIGLYGIRRLKAHPHPQASFSTALRESLGISLLWGTLFIGTGLLSAIAFGLNANPRGKVLRTLAFVGASLGELGLQWFAQRLL